MYYCQFNLICGHKTQIEEKDGKSNITSRLGTGEYCSKCNDLQRITRIILFDAETF
jgi:hypothetical protein